MPKCCKNKRKPFDKIVTIQEPDYSKKDDYNKTDLDDSANWKTFTRAFCYVETSGGNEFFANEQTQAEVSHKWTTPSCAKIRKVTPDMRLVYEGKIHEIVYGVDENEDRQYFIIGTKSEPVYAQG